MSLKTNCSGFVLNTLSKTLRLIGFSSYNLMKADTPKGDLISLMIVGGRGKHFRLNS